MDYYNLNAIPKFMIINRNGQVLDFASPPFWPKIRVLDRMIEWKIAKLKWLKTFLKAISWKIHIWRASTYHQKQ
jgi:hypothetical protein